MKLKLNDNKIIIDMELKLNDNEIIDLKKSIEDQKEKIIKLESKFVPETNCSYKRNENSSPQNLHTKKPEDLVLILSYLIRDKQSFDEANKIAKTNYPFLQQDFTFEQWEKDIIFLIEKQNIKLLKQDLENDIEVLSSFISQDAKNKMAFDKLKSKYKKD
jgi:hypothetical protein